MDVDIKKIIVTDAFAQAKNKETDGKHSLGYETDSKIRPLFTEALPMIGYYSEYKKKPYRNFTIKDKEVLEK